MLLCGNVGAPIGDKICECCIYHKSCKMYRQWKEEQHNTIKKKTNIDIIRQMSDDEIVDLVFDTTKYFSCGICRKMRGEQTDSIFCDCQEDCRSLIKQWLYMDADDETYQIKKI